MNENAFIVYSSKFMVLVRSTRQVGLIANLRPLFAEFLKEKSLVPLRLLASSTCVGLRYGPDVFNLREIS